MEEAHVSGWLGYKFLARIIYKIQILYSTEQEYGLPKEFIKKRRKHKEEFGEIVRREEFARISASYLLW